MRAASALALVLLGGCRLIDAAGDEDVCAGTGCFDSNEVGDLGAPTSLVVGDLLGDGNPDVVVADRTGGRVYLLESIPGAEPDLTDEIELPTPTVLAVGDFTPSSGLEILLLDGSNDILVVLEVDEDAGELNEFGGVTSVLDDNVQVVVGDFDDDGADDAALLYPDLGSLHIHINDGGALVGSSNFDPGEDASPLTAADFDQDDDLDLFTAHEGSLKILPGVGDGTFEELRVIGAYDEPVRAAAGIELDGDGMPELVFAGGEDVYFWGNVAEPAANQFEFDDTFDEFEITARFLAEADFQGDGLTDVAAVNLARQGDLPDAVLITSLDEDGFEDSRQLYLDEPADAAAVADMDGDGKTDLVFALSGAGEVRYYFSQL